MINTEEIHTMLENGSVVVGEDGEKLGKVSQVFLDDRTGRPEWATVAGGLFGGRESFVPLAEASVSNGDVSVPWSKAKVKDAPDVTVDANGHISEEEEATLYDYYGLTYGAEGPVDQRSDADNAPEPSGTVGYDTSGPNTDSAMTRSEEQLRVGTEQVARGKARLRKFVVTENVTTTVPVSREEVRVVTEPITEENRDEALAGGDITSEEHEVTLHEERPVVEKEVVPVERVRLDTETVTAERQVSEDVRKERVESDLSEVADEQRKGRG